MKMTAKVMILLISAVFALSVNAKVSISFSQSATLEAKTGVVFVDDTASLSGEAANIDSKSEGRLSQLIALNDFTGDFGKTLHVQLIAGFDNLLLVGVNTDEALSAAKLQNLGGIIASALDSSKTDTAATIYVPNIDADGTLVSAHIAYGFDLKHYNFNRYKADKKDVTATLQFVSADASDSRSLYEGDLQYLADGVHLTRDLASEPGKSIYPQAFVERVRPLFKGVKNIDIDVLDVRDMQKNNMGALLGVGQGSIHDPRMLVISYSGANKGDAPIVLAGKGITFDTGGISLKGNNGMWAMKSDLAGAAAVAGTLYAIAKRGENVNVVGVMPLAENMPAEDAIRPGDVLNTMQGTSIEIISTDAEGRLILADAVYYAQETFNPKLLLNIATLTGSAGRALSDEYAAVITRDFSLSEQMMQIGEQSGELVWPLPLHPNHFEQIESDIADIKNSGAGNPGASIGAAVVGTFVKDDLPWVHLDIAGVDWLSADIDVAPKGSQGWGVRFMDQLVRSQIASEK
ncbi:leucyl aminopeptidase family protein [Glaciecola siphonariae]|uniref:Probable cytosol aminopeptidase n=1 Tax=Glaciecola siphonariae TaxID=521012 RepID=A0ABV9LTB4_9ALTE